MPRDPRLVAVFPPAALERRTHLFAALEAAHPVRFEPRQADQWAGADAAVLFRDEGDRDPSPAPTTIPALVMSVASTNRERGSAQLAEDVAVSPMLRGRRLDDDSLGSVPGLDVAPGDSVLAAAGRKVLWTVHRDGGSMQRAALAPPELGAREALRDGLRPRRWLALLPLDQFLRDVAGDLAWTPPPLRAALMFDDPNLHWPSYGRLHFGDLVRHGSLHGYHVSVAMIPLDGRFVHPSAGRLFRDRPDVLSLVMHGNDHTRLELYRNMAHLDRRALVAQALRRTDAFERRHGIHVDRVMSSPHGLAAEDAIAAMFGLGMEALTADWPFPWASLDLPPPGWPLAGWEPAQLIAGLPVLPRYLFAEPLDDLVFRAYLGQPLIVYGHHRVGLDLLGAVARRINGLGDVTWTSIEAMARSNYSTRKEGSTLHVRAFSRRFGVELPDGVRELVVELPRAYGEHEAPGVDVIQRDEVETRVLAAGLGVDAGRRVTEPLSVPPGGTLEVVVQTSASVTPYDVPTPPWRPWSVFRRVLTEGRDRLLPFLSEEI